MSFDFDLFVIGAGSGGVRAARKAAETGAKVGIAEEYRFGGTCVIRGCVPKKLFVYASQFREAFDDSAGFGWQITEPIFDWKTLLANKDREIDRLESLYRANLEKAGVEIFKSRAVLEGPQRIRLVAQNKKVTAERILISTGSHPNPFRSLPGHDLCISSNEAFHLDTLPDSIMIAGGGYIALEFAGIFHGLGVETTVVYRGLEILSKFDLDLRGRLHEEYEAKGINIRCHCVFEEISRAEDDRLQVHLSDGSEAKTDAVMLALGRIPNTYGLGLADAGVEADTLGAIEVDDFSQTSCQSIWAIGDVTNRMQLTPVAIHEAMCFVESVFHGRPTKPDYDTVPTAVFSQPEIGTVGLTEDEARHRVPNLDIYISDFRPMKHTLGGRSEKMLMKVVCNADNQQVLGAHILGPDGGEMAQLLGIPIKMGATMADFSATMAVHPTAAEELVTFAGPTRRIRNGNDEAA